MKTAVGGKLASDFVVVVIEREGKMLVQDCWKCDRAERRLMHRQWMESLRLMIQYSFYFNTVIC